MTSQLLLFQILWTSFISIHFHSFAADHILWSESMKSRLAYYGNIEFITKDSLTIEADSVYWDTQNKIEVFGDIKLYLKEGVASCTGATFEFDSVGTAVRFELKNLKGKIDFGK
jgi:hypothetical protein